MRCGSSRRPTPTRRSATTGASSRRSTRAASRPPSWSRRLPRRPPPRRRRRRPSRRARPPSRRPHTAPSGDAAAGGRTTLPAMSELFLGVDVGSSSTKGVLVRPGGRVLAEAVRPHGIAHPRPGWAEQDPERDWWQGLVAVCRELLARGLGNVAAVGVSGLGPCVVAADAAGRPLRPAILYGIDTRATREIAGLTDLFGAGEVLARCGSPLTSQSAGPKLMWLARHEPAVWAATRRFFTAGSSLVHRITREYVLDHHAAGLATAGALAVWVQGIAGDVPYETLFEEAAGAGPGAGGLLALPYFNGERTPLFDPDARGLLLGLTTSHTRGHVTVSYTHLTLPTLHSV